MRKIRSGAGWIYRQETPAEAEARAAALAAKKAARAKVRACNERMTAGRVRVRPSPTRRPYSGGIGKERFPLIAKALRPQLPTPSPFIAQLQLMVACMLRGSTLAPRLYKIRGESHDEVFDAVAAETVHRLLLKKQYRRWSQLLGTWLAHRTPENLEPLLAVVVKAADAARHELFPNDDAQPRAFAKPELVTLLPDGTMTDTPAPDTPTAPSSDTAAPIASGSSLGDLITGHVRPTRAEMTAGPGASAYVPQPATPPVFRDAGRQPGVTRAQTRAPARSGRVQTTLVRKRVEALRADLCQRLNRAGGELQRQAVERLKTQRLVQERDELQAFADGLTRELRARGVHVKPPRI